MISGRGKFTVDAGQKTYLFLTALNKIIKDREHTKQIRIHTDYKVQTQ